MWKRRDLLASLFRKAEANLGWGAFSNEWWSAVASFYDARGVPPLGVAPGPLASLPGGSGLAGRMAIAEGKAACARIIATSWIT